MIRETRNILLSRHSDWAAHFTPQFNAPPSPASVDQLAWARIAEHVARAERVSSVVREAGLESALSEFGRSPHAIEQATVIAAAVQAEEVTLEMCEALLACPVDELIVYGTFLQILIDVGGRERQERVVEAYEAFWSAVVVKRCNQSVWPDRVAAVQDGLANLYVRSGRYEEAEELFSQRHETDVDELVVALTASRCYLAAGAVARAVGWLELGEKRALELGREKMAAKLAEKQVSLKKRMS